jgi:hypothetical protein
MERGSALTYIMSMAITTATFIGIDHYQNMHGSDLDHGKLIAYALAGAFIAVSMYQLSNIWYSAQNVNKIIAN